MEMVPLGTILLIKLRYIELFTSCSSPRRRRKINSWIESTTLRKSPCRATITSSRVKRKIKLC